MKISICVPTFNRAGHLANCLQSIAQSAAISKIGFEVCVSDNCSNDGTESVVHHAQKFFPIKYHRNPSNLGITRNFLNVVEMAQGEFVWLIGDDDLLLPEALGTIQELIAAHQNVDFFYVNSFHLATEYVASFPQPFDTLKLPNNMKPFSSRADSGELRFMELVDPRISFDFMAGIFLAVFRRSKWIANAHVLEPVAVADLRTFSHFDNTFPQIKIYAKAFANSKAFFFSKPLSVCLTGAREWAPMYPFVYSVRLVEALKEYRKNGLPYLRYLMCKNYALNKFIPHFVYMVINKERSGFAYVKVLPLLLGNCLYPNFYWSFVTYVVRKTRRIVEKYWQSP